MPWANLIFSCDEDFFPQRIFYIIWLLLATFRQIFRINFTYLPETEMPTHLIFRYQWHWHVVWRPLGPLGPPPPLSYWDPWPKVCNKRRSINYFWTSAKYVKHVSHWGKFKTYGLAGGIFFLSEEKKIWVFCLLLYFADVKRRTRFGYFFYGVIQSPSFVQESKTKQNKLSTSAKFKNNKTYHAPLICHFSAAKCAEYYCNSYGLKSFLEKPLILRI